MTPRSYWRSIRTDAFVTIRATKMTMIGRNKAANANIVDFRVEALGDSANFCSATSQRHAGTWSGDRRSGAA